jgi:hypothetical protein
LHNKGTKAACNQANAIAHIGRVKFDASIELQQTRIADGLNAHPASPADDMVLLYFGKDVKIFSEVLEESGYITYIKFENV